MLLYQYSSKILAVMVVFPGFFANITLSNQLVPTTVETPDTAGCETTWRMVAKVYCFKVFDMPNRTRTYYGAVIHCKGHGATLLSEMDVQDATFTSEAFWVEELKGSMCQVYDPNTTSLTLTQCNTNRFYVCKKSPSKPPKNYIEFDYFGSTKNEPVMQGDTMTLRCSLSSWSQETPIIAIGHYVHGGPFAVLKQNDSLMVEYSWEIYCDDTDKYWCQVNTTKGTFQKSVVVAAKDCPPIWCSRSTHYTKIDAHLGEELKLDACLYSAQQLSGNDTTVEWERNNVIYRGEYKPQTAIVKDNKKQNTYTVSIHLALDNPNAYGMWSMTLRSFHGGSEQISKPYRFIVGWKGPPIFCPDQATEETAYVEIGENHVTLVCILSPIAPSSVTSHAPKAGQKQTNTSVQTDIRANSSASDLTYILSITVEALSEDDIGNWSFVIAIDKFSLTYSLEIKPQDAHKPYGDTANIEPDSTRKSSTGRWFDSHMSYIVVGVSLSVLLFLVGAVAGVLVKRRRDNTYVRAQTVSPASSKEEKQYKEDDEEQRIRQSFTYNPAYQNSQNEIPNFLI